MNYELDLIAKLETTTMNYELDLIATLETTTMNCELHVSFKSCNTPVEHA